MKVLFCYQVGKVKKKKEIDNAQHWQGRGESQCFHPLLKGE